MIPERIGMMFRRIMRLDIDVTRPTVEVQLEALTDEIHTDVEVIETYGMTVWPPDECPEGLAIHLNGESDNGIVIAWRDPVFRPRFLLEGEVAFYSKWEQLIHFTQAGEVIIKDKAGTIVLLDGGGNIKMTPAGGKTYINSDVVISGKLDVAKDTTLAAKLDVNGASVKHGGVNIGKTHTHDLVSSGTDISGKPVV
jgi:phage baseplate assembly protein V